MSKIKGVLSRRTAMVLPLAAAGASLAAPAIAAASLDARLFKLIDDFWKASAEEDTLGDIYGEHQKRHFDLRSRPKPEAMRERPEDADLGLASVLTADGDGFYAASIDSLREPLWSRSEGEYKKNQDGTGFLNCRSWKEAPSPQAKARAAEIIKAHEEWKEKTKEPRSALRAERLYDAAMHRVTEIEDEISEMPARTLAGLVAKARIADIRDEHPPLTHSVIQDLLALAAQ